MVPRVDSARLMIGSCIVLLDDGHREGSGRSSGCCASLLEDWIEEMLTIVIDVQGERNGANEGRFRYPGLRVRHPGDESVRFEPFGELGLSGCERQATATSDST